MQELYDYPASQVGGGSSWVMVTSNCMDVIFWGTPVAGKFGLEGDARSSANPKFVSATDGMCVKDLVCGYGHCCMVVCKGEVQSEDQYEDKLQSFPELDMQEMVVEVAGAGDSKVTGKAKPKGKGTSKQPVGGVGAGKATGAGSKRKATGAGAGAGAKGKTKRGKK
jgi:hypothetical protein